MNSQVGRTFSSLSVHQLHCGRCLVPTCLCVDVFPSCIPCHLSGRFSGPGSAEPQLTGEVPDHWERQEPCFHQVRLTQPAETQTSNYQRQMRDKQIKCRIVRRMNWTYNKKKKVASVLMNYVELIHHPVITPSDANPTRPRCRVASRCTLGPCVVIDPFHQHFPFTDQTNKSAKCDLSQTSGSTFFFFFFKVNNIFLGSFWKISIFINE